MRRCSGCAAAMLPELARLLPATPLPLAPVLTSEAAELRRERLNWKPGSCCSEAAPALAGDSRRYGDGAGEPMARVGAEPPDVVGPAAGAGASQRGRTAARGRAGGETSDGAAEEGSISSRPAALRLAPAAAGGALPPSDAAGWSAAGCAGAAARAAGPAARRLAPRPSSPSLPPLPATAACSSVGASSSGALRFPRAAGPAFEAWRPAGRTKLRRALGWRKRWASPQPGSHADRDPVHLEMSREASYSPIELRT